MTNLDFLPERAKKFIREQIGPEKRKTTITEKTKQKKELDYFCQLLDINYIKSRKLNFEFLKNDEEHNKEKNILQELELIENEEEYIKEKNAKINEEEQIQSPPDNINIKDITTYFKNEGVVGEETLAIKIFLAAANNMSFGVEGYSGSGKTFVVDKLIDLFNEEELYRLDLSSKMAVFYDSKNINKYNTIYIPELQKALQETRSPIVEIVKNLTEGKDVKRIVTDHKKRGNTTFKINKGKSIIYTLASENYFKKDEELNRRFLRFKTNSTKKHLENILNYKAIKRQELINEDNTQDLQKKLKYHLNEIRKINTKIYDPYSQHISDYLPKTQKSVGYIDHYFSLVDASVKFNHENRNTIQYENKNILITNIEDHYLINKIYRTEFLETLKDFSIRTKLIKEVDVIDELLEKQIKWETVLLRGQETYNKLANNKKEINKEQIPEYIKQLENKYNFLNT